MDRTNPFVSMQSTDTLLSRCLFKIAQSFKLINIENFKTLPKTLKSKLLKVLTKRDLINDENIDVFIDEETKNLDFTECSNISDAGLEKLKLCKYLAKIDLNSNSTPRTEITQKGIKCLVQSCRHLQVILLRKCVNIDDTCLFEIAKSCGFKLSYLNISHCSLVTDQGLKYLGQYCKKLKAIDLNATQITDQGIFDLMTTGVGETIEEIHVSNCRLITDEAIEAILNSSKNLKFLMFHNCPRVTDASRVAIEEYTFNNGNQQRFKHLTWTIY